MLKISFSETPSEERWILQGRLTARWSRELRACWKKNHRKGKHRPCVVDLSEIKFIDKGGERLLRLLVKQGAQFIAAGNYTKHVLEKLTTKDKGSVFSRLSGFFFAAVVAAFAVRFGAECIATGVYVRHVFEQLTTKWKSSVLNRLPGFFLAVVAAVFALLIGGTSAKAKSIAVTGSLPSGPASDQVLELTLRGAIKMALRYNLGAIESGENAQITRGQRLLALGNLLPQVSAGASETDQQLNLGTVGLSGLNVSGIPSFNSFSVDSFDFELAFQRKIIELWLRRLVCSLPYPE